MKQKNLLKDSKAYYEDNDYYEIFSIAEDYENKVSNYLKKISKNKIVLDAGCGTGKFLPVLEQNSLTYIGIDLSENQLNKSRLKIKKETTQLIKSNLSNIPLQDNSVDLIISTWVFGTILDLEERTKCLNELKRVLKANGQIIFVENDENSEFEEIRNRTKDSRTKDYNDWLLINGFTINKQINTIFKFNTLEEAKECFKVIYGKTIASRIKDKVIGHKIIIFQYKND